MEIIYPTISKKSLIETLLITFSIISRIVFVGQSVLIIASETANGPLVLYIIFANSLVTACLCNCQEKLLNCGSWDSN